MLKGHVFDEQLFSSECFALFIDTFLAKNCGVVKGCNLSNSTNSVTISDGFFCIRGRFLEIQGEDTLATGNDNAYCKLVCEIDLSKENTESELTQAVLKIVKSTNTYPQLTQQDLTEDGTIYQFEFAQFKTGTNGITEFKDTRKFLDFDSIYTKVNKETQEVIEQIKKELASVKDGSAYLLKDNIAVIEGKFSTIFSASPDSYRNFLSSDAIYYPEGFNSKNTIVLSKQCRIKALENGYEGWWDDGALSFKTVPKSESLDKPLEFSCYSIIVNLYEDYIVINLSTNTELDTDHILFDYEYKLVIAKI